MQKEGCVDKGLNFSCLLVIRSASFFLNCRSVSFGRMGNENLDSREPTLIDQFQSSGEN